MCKQGMRNMDKERNATEFLKHLRSEKLKAQEARTSYTLKKLAYRDADNE